MTEAREASAAMRALVRDTLARYLWTCEGDHAPTDAAKSDAAIDALLAAIAAQEAATEAAQAEVARLRQIAVDALAEIEPAIAEGSRRGTGMHVTYTGAFSSVARMPSVRRDLERLAATLRTALKENP